MQNYHFHYHYKYFLFKILIVQLVTGYICEIATNQLVVNQVADWTS